jgi:L-cysteine desulfidase
MYGTSHPKTKPESVPHNGPSKVEVRPASNTLENVITTGVPKIGYVGIKALANIKAAHTPAKAKNMTLITYL